MCFIAFIHSYFTIVIFYFLSMLLAALRSPDVICHIVVDVQFLSKDETRREVAAADFLLFQGPNLNPHGISPFQNSGGRVHLQG